MAIGDNIRKYRKEKGLTQRALAKYAGLSESAIRQYELNVRTPKVEQSQRLASVFGRTIEELFGASASSSIESKLEEIYNELGYTVFRDDPEHKPFLIYGKKSICLERNDLNMAQEKVLAYIRFTLSELLEKGEK